MFADPSGQNPEVILKVADCLVDFSQGLEQGYCEKDLEIRHFSLIATVHFATNPPARKRFHKESSQFAGGSESEYCERSGEGKRVRPPR